MVSLLGNRSNLALQIFRDVSNDIHNPFNITEKHIKEEGIIGIVLLVMDTVCSTKICTVSKSIELMSGQEHLHMLCATLQHCQLPQISYDICLFP